MKRNAFFKSRLLMIVSLLLLRLCCFAQDSTQLQVTSPFDSVSISDISALGNLETGAVEVSMLVRSDYKRLATISFSGGGFGDFGLTDDMGVKYKYSSYNGPAGLNYGVNNGYVPIKDLRMGKSKVSIIISVQDTFRTGQSETLTFRLLKVDKSVKTIKEAHILCMLQLNYMWAGQKEGYIKNIPIAWIRPKTKPKAAPKS